MTPDLRTALSALRSANIIADQYAFESMSDTSKAQIKSLLGYIKQEVYRLEKVVENVYDPQHEDRPTHEA